MPNEKIEVPAVIEQPHIIKPLVSVDEAVKMLGEYEKLKSKIVRPDDKQIIQTQQGPKEFLKKSYWRRLAKFFGISLALEKEWKEKEEKLIGDRPTEVTTYYATVTAIAPGGQSCIGDGACSTDEKGLEKTAHNARAIAITRAKNRAISDLVGGGEVSAEEINADDGGTPLKKSPSGGKNTLITDPQRRRLFAIAKKAGYTEKAMRAHLELNYGIDSTAKVQREWYEQICDQFETGVALKEEVSQ